MGDTVDYQKLDRGTVRATLQGVSVEHRAGDEPGMVLEGYAAVFEQDSEPIMGVFYERIHRGAFRRVLRTNPDVRLLVNHEGLPLARTTNQTLELREDSRGLWMRAELPDTQLARDVLTLVQRGDLSQMSFAFSIDPDDQRAVEWIDADDAGRDLPVRIIRDFNGLYDASVVTYPAYTGTSVATTDRAGGTGEVSRADMDPTPSADSGSDEQATGAGVGSSSPVVDGNAESLRMQAAITELERTGTHDG